MSPVTVLIPAYKPADGLVEVITELLRLDDGDMFNAVVIVNDGSEAEYEDLFARVRALPGVILLEHTINLGKGAALKTGFNHILLNFPDTVSIVTADADGQHLPEDILEVARHGLANPESLILGTRTFSNEVPLRSLFGNQMTRIVMRFFTGMKLADTQTGLRAWPRALALQSLTISINGYDFEMEALIMAGGLGRRAHSAALREVPITTVYGQRNTSSRFNPLLDSMRIYFVFIRYCGAGLLTALTDNIIFIIAYAMSGDVLLSQMLSRSGGALVSFMLGFHLVFKSSANRYRAFLRFISLVILFGFISYGLIRFLNQTWGVYVIMAKIFAELILFVASFAIQREFIFGRRF